MRILIGHSIRERRLAIGLSVSDLARRLFGDPQRKSYVSNVENGKVNITIERLYDFADALECEPADLLI